MPGQASGRRVLEGLQYPFAVTSFGKHLYYTDWKTYVSCRAPRGGGARPATPGLWEARPPHSPSGGLPASEAPLGLGFLVVRRRVKTREAPFTVRTLQEGRPAARAS